MTRDPRPAPVGRARYAATDFGAEMRRISQYAFQGDWHNDLPCVCSAIKYMGVQAFPNHRNPGDLAPLVKKALARLAQASDASFRASRTHNDNLHLGAAALVALSEDRTQSLDVRPHMLIDCVTIDTEGKAFAIVTNDTIQRETYVLPGAGLCGTMPRVHAAGWHGVWPWAARLCSCS